MISVSSPNTILCKPMDSTRVKLELDLRGRWQQGNLNQIAIQPNLRLQFGNGSYLFDLQSNYQLLKANDFVLIDDFWTQAKLAFLRDRSIYPMMATNIGYALSYRIDHSFLLGAGVGSQLWRSQKGSSLEVNLFTGYLNFDFTGELARSSAAIGSLVELGIPLGKFGHLAWQTQSYHPLGKHNFWGINAALQLNCPINKQFSFQINYQFIFNNQTVMDIERVNTLMLFGFRYLIITK